MISLYQKENEFYYRKMLDLQQKLRKSEQDRLKLEERYNQLLQESRNSHNECINRLRLKYVQFLEEQRTRDERNNKLRGALDRVDSRLALITARTERLNTLKKQYDSYLSTPGRNYTGWSYPTRDESTSVVQSYLKNDAPYSDPALHSIINETSRFQPTKEYLRARSSPGYRFTDDSLALGRRYSPSPSYEKSRHSTPSYLELTPYRDKSSDWARTSYSQTSSSLLARDYNECLGRYGRDVGQDYSRRGVEKSAQGTVSAMAPLSYASLMDKYSTACNMFSPRQFGRKTTEELERDLERYIEKIRNLRSVTCPPKPPNINHPQPPVITVQAPVPSIIVESTQHPSSEVQKEAPNQKVPEKEDAPKPSPEVPEKLEEKGQDFSKVKVEPCEEEPEKVEEAVVVDDGQFKKKEGPNEQDQKSSEAEHEQGPSVESQEDPNVQYEQDQNVQNVQYQQDLNAQYQQDPNAQYQQDPNAQYQQDPNAQYQQDPNAQYQDPNLQYDPNSEQYYQDPNMMQGYDQEQYAQYEQGYNYDQNNPDYQYQQYGYDPNVQYDEGNQNYALQDGLEEAQGVEGRAEVKVEEVKEGGEKEKEESVKESSHGSEDQQEKTSQQSSKAQKKKDPIRAILDSDTDSTIEVNASKSESDFDFN